MTQTTPGTALFHRTMEWARADTRSASLVEAWEPTPWMIDAFEGRGGERRFRDVREWCFETFGDESWPGAVRPGTWFSGSASINGWAWFGFATEAMMNQFIERWRDDAWRAAEAKG